MYEMEGPRQSHMADPPIARPPVRCTTITAKPDTTANNGFPSCLPCSRIAPEVVSLLTVQEFLLLSA